MKKKLRAMNLNFARVKSQILLLQYNILEKGHLRASNLFGILGAPILFSPTVVTVLGLIN